MLQSMRNKQKSIIFVTAVLFILGMALMGVVDTFQNKHYVGKIGSQKIKLKDYDALLKNDISSWYQENKDKEIDTKTMKSLNDQLWNRYINNYIYEKEVKKRRIKVTDEDVINKFVNDPPEYIKNAPVFMTDGKFDNEKYQQALATGEPDLGFLEQHIRDQLPKEKVYEAIKQDTIVTDEDVLAKYKEDNDKADAEIIFFGTEKIKDVTISDDQISKYYNENKEDYKKGPVRQLKYVKLELKPSEKDEQEVLERIKEIRDEAVNGGNFAELAKEYSEGPSKDNGGDLNYFTRDRMVKPFSDAAFALKIGEISEPVLTKFGWHIIKLEDRRKDKDGKEEVRARHILMEVHTSQETADGFEQKANDFYAESQKNGLEKAAEKAGFDVKETAEFQENARYVREINNNYNLIQFAYKGNKGDLSELEKDSDGNFYIAEISVVKGDHYDPLDKVKEQIKMKLDRDEKLAQVKAKADEFAKKFKKEEYFDAAKKEGWEVLTQKDITAVKYISKVGKDEDFNKAVLELEENGVTELFKGNNGAYIARVTKRVKPDMEKYEKEKDKLKETAITRAQSQYVNNWYNKTKKELSIDDNRRKYYQYLN